ncbi:unnamed protein product, partial [marine sediment metagenome]
SLLNTPMSHQPIVLFDFDGVIIYTLVFKFVNKMYPSILSFYMRVLQIYFHFHLFPYDQEVDI